jgi:vacuolar-type H+-ATPase subunit C/Vma6
VTDWGDLVARSRGLSTHLLARAQLGQLTACADLGAFATLGGQYGAFEPLAQPRAADPHVLELAARRRAAERLAVLARWAGKRFPALVPLFDDEDRRSVRTLVRGAAGEVPAAMRMAGLVPTPSLPEGALGELARAGDLATIGALLTVWEHPFGAVVSEEGTRAQPDLFRLEVALARAAAERARAGARTADPAMRHFVERTIDLENLAAALVLASHRTDAAPASAFVPGGALVTIEDLRIAAESGSEEAVVQRLAPRVTGTALLAALRPGGRAPDDDALATLIREFRRRSFREPLGLAAVIAFALGQRAELRALQQIIWRIVLGMPPGRTATAVGAMT